MSRRKYKLNTGDKFNLTHMGVKAHNNGIYTVEGGTDTQPLLYAAREDEIAIISCGSALRLTLDDMETVARELQDIINSYKEFMFEKRSLA